MLAVANWELRLVLAVRAPAISQLIRALTVDAAGRHPYCKMRGEALFQQLATLLVPSRFASARHLSTAA